MSQSPNARPIEQNIEYFKCVIVQVCHRDRQVPAGNEAIKSEMETNRECKKESNGTHT